MGEELKDILKEFGHEVTDTTKNIAKANAGIGFFTQQLQSQLNILENTLAPFSKVQQGAIELAKSMGLASKSIMANSQRMIAANKQLSLSMNYNISNERMFQLQQSIASQLNRNVAIDMYGSIQKNERGEIVRDVNDSELENLVAASKIFGDESVSEMVAGFDRIGKSMSSAAKMSGKLYKEAGQYGINLGKYSQNFVKNLSMVQNYNFRNGIDGLKEMARKATEIRQEMSQISQFADKVGSVTGAVETAANLQVLGGSFAGLANPLAMLNESLTNVEGLQDRFNQMTQGMATYNSFTRQIEMSPLDRMRIKRAAEAMGVDANNLIDQAYAQARRAEIKNQMEGIGINNAEAARLLPNVGEIDSETGLAGATIGGQFRTLSEIAGSSELQAQLVEESRSEGEDIKEIARQVMGIKDLIEGRYKQAENQAAVNITRETAFGVTQLDTAIKAITEGWNDKLIEALGQIDFLETHAHTVQNIAYSMIDKLLQPISALPDREEFHNMLSETAIKEFGEGPLSTAVTNIANGVTDFFLRAFEGINDYVAKTTEEATGMQIDYWGALGKKGPAALEGNKQFIPTTAQANNIQNQEILKDFEEPIKTSNAPYIFTAAADNDNGFKKNWSVAANTETMTAAPVSPSPTASSTQAAETGPRETKHDVNLNFGGTLQVEIRDADGKILNVENLLNNKTFHDSLMTELSKQVYDKIVEMEQKGLIYNKAEK